MFKAQSKCPHRCEEGAIARRAAREYKSTYTNKAPPF